MRRREGRWNESRRESEGKERGGEMNEGETRMDVRRKGGEEMRRKQSGGEERKRGGEERGQRLFVMKNEIRVFKRRRRREAGF